MARYADDVDDEPRPDILAIGWFWFDGSGLGMVWSGLGVEGGGGGGQERVCGCELPSCETKRNEVKRKKKRVSPFFRG